MSLLKWALVFFVVSIIAALFGFTDIAAATADVARILFYIFLEPISKFPTAVDPL